MEIFITYKNQFSLPDDVLIDSGDIGVSDFSKIVDIFTGNRGRACNLVGNEPLLHDNLEKLLAIAKKSQAPLFLETANHDSERLNKIVATYNPIVRHKIYHPSVYPEDARSRMLDKLSALIEGNNAHYEALLIVHDISLDYEIFSPILKKGTFNRFHIEILPEAFGKGCNNIGRLREATYSFVGLINQVFREGLKVTLGCCVVPCIFSDESYGILSKMGIFPESCVPYFGVLPDLRIYHCRALIQGARDKLTDFKDFTQVMESLLDTYKDSQWERCIFQEC